MDNRPTLNLPKTELGKLALLLQIARMQFDPQREDHGRAGARNALIGVIHYVSTVIPGGEELVLPLNQLLYGLKSLDQGAVVPLLERAKITGRPPEALASDLFQAMAAALMDLHLQANFSRDVAASMAARELNRHGYRHKEDQKITASQVENWRDKMRAEKGSDDRAGARYRSTLDDLQKRFPNSPREARPSTSSTACRNFVRPRFHRTPHLSWSASRSHCPLPVRRGNRCKFQNFVTLLDQP